MAGNLSRFWGPLFLFLSLACLGASAAFAQPGASERLTLEGFQRRLEAAAAGFSPCG